MLKGLKCAGVCLSVFLPLRDAEAFEGSPE